MAPLWLGAGLLILALILYLWRARRTGIKGEKARNKHFERLAKELNFRYVTDDYFVQLEGSRNNRRIIVYPHNFEGPGFITLLYLESALTAKDRNWIEPNLSLGRAIVEWKRKAFFNCEISGSELSRENLIETLNSLNQSYPYIAVTPPWRYSYSPLLQMALSTWKNYAVFLAMDAGRHPASEQIEQAIRYAEKIAVHL